MTGEVLGGEIVGGERTGPGRPRRYDAAEELRRLFDAAFTVVSRDSYQQVTVADILAEAGVARRSFYRHFASKDELLAAMLHRDAERFASWLDRRVAATEQPWSGLVSWVDGVLDLAADGPRGRRAAVLASAVALRSLPPRERRHTYAPLLAPLTAVLAAGAADGSFPHVRPAADAPMISAVTWETLIRLRELPDPARRHRLRTDLLSFLQRALTAAATPEPGPVTEPGRAADLDHGPAAGLG